MFSASKKVLLMGLAAVAVGIFSSSCIVFEDAEVKYNWDYGRQNRIIMVAASYDDVLDWYDEYYKGNYDEVTAKPRYYGNRNAPENMYSSTLGRSYRDIYYPITSGDYTAVCTVRDRDGFVIDIVANYRISLGDDRRFYEVYFNVGEVLDNYYYDPDNTWDFGYKYYRAKTPESEPEVPQGGLIKTFEKDGVSYQVFRRPIPAGSDGNRIE